MIDIFAGNKLMHDATGHAPNEAIINSSFDASWLAQTISRQWQVPTMERQHRATGALR
jgi:hypothetical protein